MHKDEFKRVHMFFEFNCLLLLLLFYIHLYLYISSAIVNVTYKLYGYYGKGSKP